MLNVCCITECGFAYSEQETSDWESEDSCYVIRTRTFTFFENEEEIFYIIKGTATYDDNGETVILNEGDSCLCLGGEKHSIANRMSEGSVQLFAVILTY